MAVLAAERLPATGGPPMGPTHHDDRPGDPDRKRDRLKILRLLSRCEFLSLYFVLSLTYLSTDYGSELVFELEDEGLVRLEHKPWGSLLRRATLILDMRRPTPGDELFASITEEGRTLPELASFCEQEERIEALERLLFAETSPEHGQRTQTFRSVLLELSVCFAATLSLLSLCFAVAAFSGGQIA